MWALYSQGTLIHSVVITVLFTNTTYQYVKSYITLISTNTTYQYVKSYLTLIFTNKTKVQPIITSKVILRLYHYVNIGSPMVCVCFLSPSLGEGIENTQRVGYKSYQITNHGRFFLSHICHSIPAFRSDYKSCVILML
jgi:hypothetical protein